MRVRVAVDFAPLLGLIACVLVVVGALPVMVLPIALGALVGPLVGSAPVPMTDPPKPPPPPPPPPRPIAGVESIGRPTPGACACGCAEITCSSPWRGDEHLDKPPVWVEPAPRRRGPRRITQGEALADLPDLRERPKLADQPYRWRWR